MTHFGGLSLREQKLRWRKLAHAALSVWKLEPFSLKWLGYSSNAVFKVDTESGSYVLRLQIGEGIDESRLRSELQWLCMIRTQTNLLAPLPVPVPVVGPQKLFNMISHDLLPAQQTVCATLFRYIEGENKPAKDLQVDDLRRVGEYLARLHRDAQLKPPSGFDRPRHDREGLVGSDSPYYSEAERHHLDSAQFEILAAVTERVRITMARLASSERTFGLIHADLLTKNILFCDSSLAALDFEYCGWGYFLYDLAPLLWQLKGERADQYPTLEAALWAGYTAIQVTAESYRQFLETFIAARQLASCRWLLSNLGNPTVRAAAPSLLVERCVELQGFLDTGILRRTSATL